MPWGARSRASSVDVLVAAVPVLPASPQHAVVGSLMADTVKTYTVCHGSVMEVPLRDVGSPGAMTDDKVFLYPNVQRAMAEVASKTVDAEKVDWLDMMLGNLGQQSGSTGGVIDLPGAQHARTFQSAPGKTTFYARLDIHPKPVAMTQTFALGDYTNGAPMSYPGHWPTLQARSASSHVQKRARTIPPAALNQPPAVPAGPTDQQIVAWIETLTLRITHPFIVDQVAEFDLAANTAFDTVVLADARGSLYATCGVLPRKAVVVPKDFIDPALKKLEPTFGVGPILGFDRQGSLVPIIPAPTIEGMDAEFVHDDDATYPEMPLPPTPPVAELPAKRVRLTEGWVRMFKQKL